MQTINDIIDKYSNNKNNKIINKIFEIFKPKKTNLISLNLLSNNQYYWFICKTSNIIYIVQLYNKEFRCISNKHIQKKIYNLNRYTYKHVIIKISRVKESNNKFIFILNKNKYIINNISIINKTITNIDINKKRKNILNHLSIKKIKKVTTNNSISGSSIRNYMLNDPLLDYLEKNNSNYNKKSTNIFLDYIMKAGVDFENELIKIIKQKHIVNTVIENITLLNKKSYDKYYNMTLDLMKKGCPIIYQGFVYNYSNNTYGIPDLIVRSDYINTLMNNNIIDIYEEKQASKKLLNANYHYKIIDIKHSNIYLDSLGINILNTGSIPAYKGQIYIYLIALNKMLGININKAFIWGKQYNYTSKGTKYNIKNFLNKLGTIDYDTFDKKYINIINNAIEWKKIIKNNDQHLSLIPIPNVKELFPNMKNEKDGVFKQTKQIISKNIKEITDIWYCNINKRNNAHNNLIFSWDDKRCTSKNMGFNKGKISKIIDKILNINRQNKDIILPNKILYERNIWNNKENDYINFYLDFETLNSNFGSIIKNGIIYYDNNQFIFLIGVGYSINNKWIFKHFLMKSKTLQDELNIFIEFNNYINNILKLLNKKYVVFYHWSAAEVTFYNQFKKRHNIIGNDYIFKFYDLNKVFINEPIVIKGAFNFSLKTIAKIMYKNNFIKSNWDNNNVCANGLSALILANKLYEQNNNINNNLIMKDIIKYNEIDCKVLWEIHNYLINNL